MEITIKKYDLNTKREWDAFIATAKNATFLFYRDFMEYHSDRFEDYSLLVYNKEELIAVLPANISEGMLYSHQGLTYGGLVLQEGVKFEAVCMAFKQLLVYVEEQEVQKIHFKLLPKHYNSLPSDEIEYLLFKLKATLTRRDLTSLISLNNKLGISSSNRKRGIKKGIKNELKVVANDQFDAFWNEILIPNLRETHQTAPVHSLAEIVFLKKNFPKQIQQFNVYKENVIVAGVTIFETKHVAHAQYISANKDKQQLGSLDFLFNYLINEAFASKLFFDFGISNENRGENINKGLLSWKESFGARSIQHDFYEIDTKNHTFLNDVFL